MNRYYEFLKDNTISFSKLLIDKYSYLGLDELEVMILLKLDNEIKSSNKFNIENITKNMTASSEVIREKLASLISNDFITLELVKKKEVYSLDQTYVRLADLLEKDEVKENETIISNDIKKIVSLMETEFKKILSPIELELVYKWFNDDKFSYSEIYEAVLEALKHKKTNLRYVDAILNKKETPVNNANTDGLQDLFNQVYGKIK